ncbi:cellulose binding domain-containing protein [Actinomadura keratinilytica]|uniref:CBM2 domain-containing protein n=1 Tax=Actinomadura keratinilytica TaxID=547461 RepID=A0ABP7Z9L4_9ACTN
MTRFLALLATGVTLLALLAALPAAPSRAAAAVRIMPLGDSITGSPGCWRALLWNRLQETGHTDIDFVGTLPTQGCSVPYDGDNEGHGGALVTDVAAQNLLPGWLAATRPDIVLMHFGTNDVWSNRPTATILDAYTTLVGQMRASNPAMKILVARIIPMNPATCAECADRVVALNQAIPDWAAAHSTAESPITVVDQWTGFSTDTDTYDGVHPNDSGNQKISDRWYPALVSALGTVTPPTTPPPGDVTCTLTVTNQWPGGFQGTVTIGNDGPALTSWRVGFDLAATWELASTWNGTFTRSGTTVTVSNASWNAAVPTGGTASAGFTATGSGALPAACEPA